MSRKYIQHLRSNAVKTIQQYGLDKDVPKVPETDNLKEGEIAINYAKDNEVISIKNDDEKIVKFLNEKVVYENEEITAAAISQLKDETNQQINEIYNAIENIQPGGDIVQSDWNESDEESMAFIKNKPTIPTKTSELTNDSGFVTAGEIEGGVQSDWNESDEESMAFIKNKPTIPTKVSDLTNDGINDAPLVIQKNEVEVATFTANAADRVIANIVVPTKTSDLRNDSGFITMSDVTGQVQSDWNESDEESLAYIQNKPTIPTVNDAPLVIQKNGSVVATFTANAADRMVANIVVPTKTSDLNNDSGFVTAGEIEGGVQSDWNETSSASLAFIKNKPTIPTKVSDLTNDGINDAPLVIQKNGADVATFTANAANRMVANIEVPTKTSDLTNDSGFVTSEVMKIQITRTGTTFTSDKSPAEMKEALTTNNRILKLYYNNKEYLLTSVNGINGTSGNMVFERVNDDNTYSKITIAWTDIEDSTTTTVSYETNAYIGFDNTPTANSTKAVTSGGAKTYVDNKVPLYVTLTSEVTALATNDYFNITSDTDYSTIVNAYTNNRVVVLRNCVIEEGQSTVRPDDTGHVYYLRRKHGTTKLQFIAIEDVRTTGDHSLKLLIFEVSPGNPQDVWTYKREEIPYIYNANWIKIGVYDHDNPTYRKIEKYDELLEAINNGQMIMLQNHLATVIDTTSEIDTIILKFGSSNYKASGGVTTVSIVKYEVDDYCEVAIEEVSPLYDASWLLNTNEHTLENFMGLVRATDNSVAICMHMPNNMSLYAIQTSTFNANISLTFLDNNSPSIITYNTRVENGNVVVSRSEIFLALTS